VKGLSDPPPARGLVAGVPSPATLGQLRPMPDHPASPPPPRTVAPKLVAWFRAEQRDLPFRATKDPYAIWVSEVMLQQTTVAAVLPYYTRFMQRFPSVRALARATESEVLEVFAGLGYYARAVRLHAAARFVAEHCEGEVPRSLAELKRLPGVGPYTAAAIASIAFDLPEPLLDTNASRVLARLCACSTPLAERNTERKLRDYATRLLEFSRPSEVNQALMELGALVCTASDPDCQSCPLTRSCRARANGSTARLPVLAPRPEPIRLRAVALVLQHAGRLLVLDPDPRARHWARLHTLPYRVLTPDEDLRQAFANLLRSHLGGVRLRLPPPSTTISYAITRHRFRCEVVQLHERGALPRPVRGRFVSRKELAALPLPAPHRRLIRELV